MLLVPSAYSCTVAAVPSFGPTVHQPSASTGVPATPRAAAAAVMVCSLKDCAASSAQAWATVPASDRPDAVKTVRPYMPGQYERLWSAVAIADGADAAPP